jgi:hypothetical protein
MMSPVEGFLQFGASGVIGALFGIGAVTWIGPTTTEGAILIIIACAGFGIAIGVTIEKFTGGKKKASAGKQKDMPSTGIGRAAGAVLRDRRGLPTRHRPRTRR